MKKYLFLFLLLMPFGGFAQNTIPVPNYKYVLVPEKFSFLREKNQYNLNRRLRSLLEEKGYIAYLDNADLPLEIANNKCLALNAELLEKNSMLSTNLTLLLKDCKGNLILESKQGKSREKEYQLAYTSALMDAVGSLDKINPTAASPLVIAKDTITVAPVVSATLYAQPTVNGFQLVDSAAKIVLSLLKTSVADYFIADNGITKGLVFKKDNNWFFEYYKNDSLIAERLLIKF